MFWRWLLVAKRERMDTYAQRLMVLVLQQKVSLLLWLRRRQTCDLWWSMVKLSLLLLLFVALGLLRIPHPPRPLLLLLRRPCVAILVSLSLCRPCAAVLLVAW